MKCDMHADCAAQVTHIGEKGYIYCTTHAGHRQGYERCRRLRPWECRRIESGKPLRSYKPITRAAHAALEAQP